MARQARWSHGLAQSLSMFGGTNSCARRGHAPPLQQKQPPIVKCAISNRTKVKPRPPKCAVNKVNRLTNKASAAIDDDILTIDVPDQRRRIKSTFEQDIETLIELSRQFQRECREQLSIRSAVAVVTNATVNNRSCMSSRVQPAQKQTSHMSAEAMMPVLEDVSSLFDDQQLREYGTKLVDVLFQNVMFAAGDHAAPATQTQPVKVKKKPSQSVITTKRPMPAIRSAVVSSSRDNRKSCSTTPSRVHQATNKKSKQILNNMEKRSQDIKTHSCVAANTHPSPKTSDSARGKQKFLSQFYDFQKTHPDIALECSESVIPRRVVAPTRSASGGQLPVDEQTANATQLLLSPQSWHQTLTGSRRTTENVAGSEETKTMMTNEPVEQNDITR